MHKERCVRIRAWLFLKGMMIDAEWESDGKFWEGKILSVSMGSWIFESQASDGIRWGGWAADKRSFVRGVLFTGRGADCVSWGALLQDCHPQAGVSSRAEDDSRCTGRGDSVWTVDNAR